jgi:hypothetical protein
MRPHGISVVRAHEHSTTAAPYWSSSGQSAGESVCFAFALVMVSLYPPRKDAYTYEITTPANFCPTCISLINPNRISRLPEQRLGSQWPKSQQAAWKGGRAAEPAPSSPFSSLRRRSRLPNLPRPREAKSFLWRTIMSRHYNLS